jgi:hypothetical protein
MMSHRLPEPVISDLHLFAVGVEEQLQADAHKVTVAVGEHSAFNVRWVENDLTRALICATACARGAGRFRVEELGNGGVDLSHAYGGVERMFRLRSATRDASGFLRVMSNSDSILTGAARQTEATLFDPVVPAPPAARERWVLAYRLHPGIRTFLEVTAGRVVGLLTHRPPYRLDLADLAGIPFTIAPPSNFPGKGDDLDLGDEDERGDEEEHGDGQPG